MEIYMVFPVSLKKCFKISTMLYNLHCRIYEKVVKYLNRVKEIF